MKVIHYFIISLVIFISACGDKKSADEYIQSGQQYFAKKD
jgi:hypothetical protein